MSAAGPTVRGEPTKPPSGSYPVVESQSAVISERDIAAFLRSGFGACSHLAILLRTHRAKAMPRFGGMQSILRSRRINFWGIWPKNPALIRS